jgi:hypothetical protein
MNENELAVLTELENCIKGLANEFQGQRALNFFHEAELTAHLMSNLRNKPVIGQEVKNNLMYLAHLEWPCLKERRIDLVLWESGSCEQAIQLWHGRSNCAKHIPLIAAVQIKRGRGKLTSWYSTKKDIADLESLDTFENLGKPTLYFLEWVDHGLRKEHENDIQEYRDIQKKLKRWCSEALNRRAFLISRDNIGFAYPEGAWIVNPLPEGVIENL